jgi:capsular exopolysaccharide synthesis family protein
MPEPLPEFAELTRPSSAANPARAMRQVPVAPTAGNSPKESVPLAVLHGLLRRWRLALGVGILVAGSIAAGVWFLLPPPVPTAAAKLYVPLKPLGVIGENPDPPLERQTQAELIKSRLLISAAIRPPEVANLPTLKDQEEPVDWIAKKLTVEFMGPEILRLSLSCDKAEDARVLVDAIKNSYLTDVGNRSNTERTDKLKRLGDLAAGQKQLLSKLRETRKTLAEANGIFDRTEQQVFQQETLRAQVLELRKQQMKAESDLRTGKLLETVLAGDGPVEVPTTLLDQAVDKDRRVIDSAREVKDLDRKFDQAKQAARSQEQQDVKDAKAKWDAGKKDLEELRTKVAGEVRDQLVSKTKGDRSARLLQTKQENALLEQQIALLKTEIDTYTKSLADNRKGGNELAPIDFEIKQTEVMLASILKSITMLQVEQDAPLRVTPLENAIIIKVDETRRKALLAGAGAAGGFLLVAVLVGLIEFFLRRVDSVDAVTRGLGIRVVGSHPRPRVRPFRWWAGQTGGETEGLAEAIASTRTMLLHGDGLAAHRVLLITSPVSGEGKTTLSVQLAVSIAQSGRRTLLIDGDLRNPSVHERLGMTNGAGLCEVLREEASLFDVVRETAVPGLMLITAGRWTPDTPRTLLSDRLSHLFAVWQDQSEFVLIDSSPVLPVTDALLLARHAHGVILSLLQGVSRLTQTTEAMQKFATLGVHVLGAIVNGTSHRGYGGARRYYYTAPPAEPAPTEQS